MCVDDYLIKRAHYFCQSKVPPLATHQILTRAPCHPLFKASTHNKSISLEKEVASVALAELSFYCR